MFFFVLQPAFPKMHFRFVTVETATMQSPLIKETRLLAVWGMLARTNGEDNLAVGLAGALVAAPYILHGYCRWWVNRTYSSLTCRRHCWDCRLLHLCNMNLPLDGYATGAIGFALSG